MADACDAWRTNLAQRTPVYDKVFLKDYTPLNSPVLGRHETGTWETGTGDTHYFDTLTIGQPDLQNRWQRISAAECDNACNPPSVFVGFGTRRDSYYPEQLKLKSQTFCLTQLEHSTEPAQQIAEWMRGAKQLPEMYMTDFLRVHAVDLATTVQICGANFNTFTPDITGPVTNITGQLTTIDLGGAANLPTSELTWPYLNYLTTQLELNGYHEAPSGLPMGMFNLITHSRCWYKLTNGMESMKDMMALTDYQQASPLYKIGLGIQRPFGNLAPTLDERQIRFQLMPGGLGVLNRVEPYLNQAATTGIEPVFNPAWLNATYGLSFLWHPMAIKVWTKAFTKINEKVPSVVNSLYGQWQFINDNVLIAQQPDGTNCTLQNEDRTYFYWLCKLYCGFQYKYRKFIMPILHKLDGSGKCSTVDQPVCCDDPAYVAQNYSDDPTVCEDA
jgi:hypothetical protein